MRGNGFTCAALLLAFCVSGAGRAAAQSDQTLTVRITSPLGRTGSYGAIRVVAQVRGLAEPPLAPPTVKFFADGQPIGEDVDGPPYAVEWVDENPFERRELSVEVVDAAGRQASNTIVLQPFEITEVTEISSVLLEATVEDVNGRRVNNLTEQSFLLTENGAPQKLDMVRSEEMPATYLLLLDSSQSMSRRIDFVREAARRLIAFIKPEDRVLVVPFSRHVGAVTGPTDDRNTIIEAIGAVRSSGGTAIIDSLFEASKIINDSPGRHAVVLMTDGYDEHSERAEREALDALKRAQATTYVVGIGGVAGVSLRGERFLKDLAKQTSGKAFFPTRDSELPSIHDHISTDVRQRYLLSYTPTDQRRDGTWRVIALTTGDESWTIRTRPGYYAPSPPPVRPLLEFTATDVNNQYLDVSSEDLEVVEDGELQRVESFQEAIAPVSIVLTLDASGSMRRVVDTVKDAAHRFVKGLQPNDTLGVVLFADAPAIAQDLTTDRDEAGAAIEQYVSRGGTALWDALALGFERLRRVEGRRALVVLTDGRDENDAGTAPGSLRVFDDVQRLAQETEVTVFTIGLGPNVDRARLESLATASGGLALFPTEAGELDAEYARIIENLRRRYVLSYTSTNSTRDGKWRNVEIKSQAPHIVIRSRGGYFAPEDMGNRR
jgi:VWFA-related protein